MKTEKSSMDICEEYIKRKGGWVTAKEIASNAGLNYSRVLNGCNGLLQRGIIEVKKHDARLEDLSLKCYKFCPDSD